MDANRANQPHDPRPVVPPIRPDAPFADHKRRPFANAIVPGQPAFGPPHHAAPHQPAPPVPPIAPARATANRSDDSSLGEDADKFDETDYTRLVWWLALLGHTAVIPGLIALPMALREQKRREAAGEKPSKKIREALVLCKLLFVVLLMLIVVLWLLWIIISTNGGWSAYSRFFSP